MNAKLILNFNNSEDLLKVLQFLKETGLESLVFQTNAMGKPPKQTEKNWAFGIGKLGGKLDQLNLRDFAHE